MAYIPDGMPSDPWAQWQARAMCAWDAGMPLHVSPTEYQEIRALTEEEELREMTRAALGVPARARVEAIFKVEVVIDWPGG